MTPDLDAMFASRDLRANPMIAVQVVMATRLSILFARAGRDPLPGLAVRLRSMRAAQAAMSLVEAIGRVWPENVTMRRPCCTVMSPDEMLIAAVAAAAAQGDRRAAMDAMRDLLPCLSRDRLFREMVELVDAIRAAWTQPADYNYPDSL